MVRSRIDNAIDYPDQYSVFADDMHHESAVYQLPYYDMTISILLGQRKEKNADIAYYPIYLVKDDRQIVLPLGVYEFPAYQSAELLDADGDVDLARLSAPLIYSFVIPETVARSLEVPVSMVVTLPEQTQATYQKEREVYTETPQTPWIQKFMHSNAYTLMDKELSLFEMFSGILNSMGQKVTEADARKMLAKVVTKAAFDKLRAVYEVAKQDLDLSTTAIQDLQTRLDDLRGLLHMTRDLTKQNEIVEEAEKLQDEFTALKVKISEAKPVVERLHYMKGVTGVEMLKLKVQTPEFRGDWWALGALEVAYNVKIILLSGKHYATHEYNQVFVFPSMEDSQILKMTKFQPTYYVLAEVFTSQKQKLAFKLIKFHNHLTLRYKELAFVIRKVIVKRLVDQPETVGTYLFIPDFQLFATA